MGHACMGPLEKSENVQPTNHAVTGFHWEEGNVNWGHACSFVQLCLLLSRILPNGNPAKVGQN